MEQYFMRVDDFVKRTHCWDYIFDLNSFKMIRMAFTLLLILL